MSRIFARLAALNYLLLLAAFGSGILSKLRGGLFDLDSPLYPLHFYLGLSALLSTLFVHILVQIQLLGTGRWVKEVCEAYELPDAGWPRQTRRLKLDTTPKAILSYLIMVATGAAGMANQHQEWPWYLHLVLAVATLLSNAWVHCVEYRNLAINTGILEGVLRDVERIRAARGLPSNQEALRQES